MSEQTLGIATAPVSINMLSLLCMLTYFLNFAMHVVPSIIRHAEIVIYPVTKLKFPNSSGLISGIRLCTVKVTWRAIRILIRKICRRQ